MDQRFTAFQVNAVYFGVKMYVLIPVLGSKGRDASLMLEPGPGTRTRGQKNMVFPLAELKISGQRQQTKRSQHRVRSVLGAQSRDSYFTLGCQGRFSEK